eukprot:2931384-Rhodomonas_salina.1
MEREDEGGGSARDRPCVRGHEGRDLGRVGLRSGASRQQRQRVHGFSAARAILLLLMAHACECVAEREREREAQG